jgi:WD40 repeat protein/tRNA A-37 threonylcarbamoyl transferase component Bud32
MSSPSPVEAIFLAALDKETAEQRAAYVEGACGGDPDLCRQVRRLLDAHPRVGKFLEKPAMEQVAARACPPEESTQENPSVPQIDAAPQSPSDGSLAATQANSPGGAREDPLLDFLAPSQKPGALGRLGHYEVLEVVGRGGMGVVLKAFDEKLHRVVAIKVLAPQLATSATARQRFVREAQAAAAVRNEHVVDIHAVEEANAMPYLVMEYVSGISLQERLDQTGPLALKEILRIGLQTAAGLAAAHGQGLVHRDIKPANILLENGVERVKITDFGLARAVDDASLTQSGVVAGTPQYMAPEQAGGEAVDHRADLFSLGSVLYALCTGRPPFRASGTMAVLKRVCEDTPRPIPEINTEIPDWLVALIARLHAKVPSERVQSAADVSELLSQLLAEVQRPAQVPLPEQTAEVSRPSPPPGRAGRGRWALAAAILLVLLGGLALTEATGVTRLATTVIRVFTTDGTLVVEVEDPSVNVTIEGEGGLVITGAGPQEVRLRPGSYRLQATKDGKPVKQEVVTITPGGTRVVRISLEPVSPATATSPFRFEPPPPGPLDLLDPAQIPATERFDWQPKELVAVLGEHRGRHWTDQRHVAVSPDGKLAASCGEDGLIYLWEADTLRLRALLTGHTAGVWSVAFAPDSRRLLSGSEDGTLRLWDLKARRELRCFKGHAGEVSSVAFSPDGGRALSGNGDRTVRLWDVDTGKELGRWPGHTGCVRSVTFSPDGSFALSGSDDRSMRLWEVKTGKEVRCFQGHTDCCRIVGFHPDGRRALSCSHDHTVRLWELATGKELRRFEGHRGAVYYVALSPDGRRAISGGWEEEGIICFWDVEAGQQLHRVRQTTWVNCVAFAPSGQQALIGSGGAIRWWNVATAKELNPQRPVGYGGTWGYKVAFSPDGRRILSCMTDEFARLWDVQSGKQLHSFAIRPQVWGVAFSPDGRQALCGGDGMGLYEVESGKVLRRFEEAKGIRDLALSGDGRRVVSAHGNGSVRLWDAQSGRELSCLRGHRSKVSSVAISPDQRRALSGGDGSVLLWDLANGQESFRVDGLKPYAVRSVAFSPDGCQAASADDLGQVQLWDLTGAEPRVRPLPRWHSRMVLSVAFSPDGKALASAGYDGRIILSEMPAGKKMREWRLPGPVSAVCFARDGRHLATANANGTLYILRLPER